MSTNFTLQIDKSSISQVVAFPTSATCFGALHWKAECWVNSPTAGNLPYHIYKKICDHVGSQAVQLYEFGSPHSYLIDPVYCMNTGLLFAFPHLQGDIFKDSVLSKWMNQVVIPAIGAPDFPPSLESIRSSSWASTTNFYMDAEMVRLMWDRILQKVQSPGFEEFREIKLVILAKYPPSRYSNASRLECVKSLVKDWEGFVDMKQVNQADWYVEFTTDSSVTFGRQPN